MKTVLLGNPEPMMQVNKIRIGDDGEPVIERIGIPAAHLNQSVTRVEMAPDFDDDEHVERTLSTDNDRMLAMIARQLGDEHRQYAVGVREIEQLWGTHSGGKGPTWVTCPEDPDYAAALAEHFGCPQLEDEPTALLVFAGRDAHHAQMFSTSAQPASANYMAVSANVTAPSTGSTTLPGEITTAGGTLIRKQGTYAHTGGTNTTTLTTTFTANGTDALPVTLGKLGILNAITVGTLFYETLLNATSTLTISGDSCTITETVTAG